MTPASVSASLGNSSQRNPAAAALKKQRRDAHLYPANRASRAALSPVGSHERSRKRFFTGEPMTDVARAPVSGTLARVRTTPLEQ